MACRAATAQVVLSSNSTDTMEGGAVFQTGANTACHRVVQPALEADTVCSGCPCGRRGSDLSQCMSSLTCSNGCARACNFRSHPSTCSPPVPAGPPAVPSQGPGTGCQGLKLGLALLELLHQCLAAAAAGRAADAGCFVHHSAAAAALHGAVLPELAAAGCTSVKRGRGRGN